MIIRITYPNLLHCYVEISFVFSSLIIIEFENDISKRGSTPAIFFFCMDQPFIPHGVTNAQLFRDCEPIRLLETPGSLSEYSI